MHMRSAPRLGLTLTAGLVAAVLVSAQQPQQPTFRAGTNVVRVDLYATRDGKMIDDLKQSEVDVLEDGVKQTIESFERVVVRPPVSQELRAEPNTVAESRQMAADARARIFVIFLDTYHTRFANAARMRAPLQQFLDRVVGQDDLVGLMTPEMSAREVTLGRRTTVVSRLLDNSFWGRREQLADNDPVENTYEGCYAFEPGIAREMKARRREKIVLDSLDDLLVHLGGLRDERKAVLAVSEGWLQYRPDQSLARPLQQTDIRQVLQPPEPVDRGATRRGAQTTAGANDLQKCEADRVALANMDDSERLMRIGERANRVNVSFYPVGSQGLAVCPTTIRPPTRCGSRVMATPTWR